MARITQASLSAKHPVLKEILDGEFDGELMEDLQHAITLRKKSMFRPGTRVKLIGTRNVEIDGKLGTVVRVGPKRIAVDVDGDPYGHYNVPVRMLEVVQPLILSD